TNCPGAYTGLSWSATAIGTSRRWSAPWWPSAEARPGAPSRVWLLHVRAPDPAAGTGRRPTARAGRAPMCWTSSRKPRRRAGGRPSPASPPPSTSTRRPPASWFPRPGAGRLLAGAVAEGVGRREADQADGRRALLVRTPAGRRLSAQAHAFRRQVFGEAMAGWPAADRAEFARLLTRFVESLAEVTR